MMSAKGSGRSRVRWEEKRAKDARSKVGIHLLESSTLGLREEEVDGEGVRASADGEDEVVLPA
jgi:hypothetical protein